MDPEFEMKRTPWIRRFNERGALLIAIGASAVTLLATFSLAAVIRSYQGQVTIQANDSRTSLDLAATGKHLFLMNCAHCHGDDARGDEGPDLHNLHKNDMRIHHVITNGIKGEMPSFARKLNDSDIRALTAYIRSLT